MSEIEIMQGDCRAKEFLVAEYCDAQYYTGWHLYFRDNTSYGCKGGWGWVRRPDKDSLVKEFLSSLGFFFTGDGTGDDDAIAQFAGRFPLKGKKSGGRARGGVEVETVDGEMVLIQSKDKDDGSG